MIGAINSSFSAPVQLAVKQAETPADSNLETEEIKTDEVAAGESQNDEKLAESEEQSGSSGVLADQELTPEEEKVVRELQQRDREVRAHERAHKTVAGPLAGPISYDFQRGPDGEQYAIGGEVSIDTSPVPNNPEATIRKMDIVVRAALAPAEPSAQDRAVARAAQQTRLQAQREARILEQEERAEAQGEDLTPLEEIREEAKAGESDENTTPLAEFTQAIQNLSKASELGRETRDSRLSFNT